MRTPVIGALIKSASVSSFTLEFSGWYAYNFRRIYDKISQLTIVFVAFAAKSGEKVPLIKKDQ